MTGQQRYVCFLDLLGFKEAVLRAHSPGAPHSPERIRALLEAVQNEVPLSSKGRKSSHAAVLDYEITIFSDSIILSAPVQADTTKRDQYLIGLVSCIREIAVRFLSSGFLVRGGLSQGWMHHQGAIAFGEGMLRAYELESRHAVHPRIIVGRHAIDGVRRSIELDNGYCLSADGPAFIDILLHYREIVRSHREMKTEDTKKLLKDSRITVLRNIRNMVEEGLAATRDVPNVFAKYRWFADYMNGAVLADAELLGPAFPKRIDIGSH